METIEIKKGLTIKPVLNMKYMDKDGKRKIEIRLTLNRKTFYFPTDQKINPEYWENNEVKKKGDGHIQYEVNKKITEIEKVTRQLMYNDVIITIDKIRKGLNTTSNGTVYTYMKDLIEDLKKDMSAGTIQNYENELKRLFGKDDQKGFCSRSLTFSDVDPLWLRKYKAYLQGDNFKTKTGHLTNNSVHRCFKILKKIFNKAIEDGQTKNYPFKEYSENPKYIQTDRTFLTENEVMAIESVLKKPIPDHIERTIYYFLLGCYSGLRYSDWARFNYEGFITKGINGDNLITSCVKNNKTVSIKVHDRLRVVINKLRTLPKVDAEQKVNYYLKTIATLAGIQKKLSTHVARHTFATRCAELGISKETTADLMGISTRTCNIYYHITNNKRDAEMEKWDQAEKNVSSYITFASPS